MGSAWRALPSSCTPLSGASRPCAAPPPSAISARLGGADGAPRGAGYAWRGVARKFEPDPPQALVNPTLDHAPAVDLRPLTSKMGDTGPTCFTGFVAALNTWCLTW